MARSDTLKADFSLSLSEDRGRALEKAENFGQHWLPDTLDVHHVMDKFPSPPQQYKQDTGSVPQVMSIKHRNRPRSSLNDLNWRRSYLHASEKNSVSLRLPPPRVPPSSAIPPVLERVKTPMT